MHGLVRPSATTLDFASPVGIGLARSGDIIPSVIPPSSASVLIPSYRVKSENLRIPDVCTGPLF